MRPAYSLLIFNKKTQRLSNEELEFYIKKYKANKDKEALDKICMSLLNYVISIAKKTFKAKMNKGFSLEDFISEGLLGVIDAVEKFKFNSGASFPTYARFWIQQKMIFSHKNYNPIRVSSNSMDIVFQVKKHDKKLNPIEKKNYISATNALRTEYFDDDNDDLANFYYEDSMNSKIMAKQMYEFLSKFLSEEELKLANYRFGLTTNYTMKYYEIAEIYKVSKESIRMRLKKIVQKLKECDYITRMHESF